MGTNLDCSSMMNINLSLKELIRSYEIPLDTVSVDMLIGNEREPVTRQLIDPKSTVAQASIRGRPLIARENSLLLKNCASVSRLAPAAEREELRAVRFSARYSSRPRGTGEIDVERRVRESTQSRIIPRLKRETGMKCGSATN